MISFLTIVILMNQLFFPSLAKNQIGCLINENFCDSNEFCFNDSILGICLNNGDLLNKKSIRSEQLIDTITPFIKTPIRLHKYTKDIFDYADENSNEYLVKREVENNEDRLKFEDPNSWFISLKKRPTLGYPIEKFLAYDDRSDSGEIPFSIDDLLKTLKRNNFNQDLYYDDQDYDEEEDYDYGSDEIQDSSKKRIDRISNYNSIMQMQKRDSSLFYDLDDDNLEKNLKELSYASNEHEPIILKWLYVNQIVNYQDRPYKREQTHFKIINRLNSIIKKNIEIENIFDSIDNMKKQTESPKNINQPRNLLLIGFNNLNSKSNHKTILNENTKTNSLFKSKNMNLISENGQFDMIDGSYVFIELDKKVNLSQAEKILKYISSLTSHRYESFHDLKCEGNMIVFRISQPNSTDLVSKLFLKQLEITKETGFKIVSCGIGKNNHRISINSHPFNINTYSRNFIWLSIAACISILTFLSVFLGIFWCKRKEYLSQKLIRDVGYSKSDDIENLVDDEKNIRKSHMRRFVSWLCSKNNKSSEKKENLKNIDYQEFCRQRIQCSPTNKNAKLKSSSSFTNNMNEPTNTNIININNNIRESKSESSRSSTSSWSEEPINSFNIDITTGHVVLGYMEKHLNDKNRLNKDWEYLSSYQAEPNKTEIGGLSQNLTKNRYSNILPYDHTIVKLGDNIEENDYINANYIIDDDPKNPTYIATQGPLIHTSGDFWQMVWEQKSAVIISLCRTVEYGSLKCNQYWPSNGFEIFSKFEIHLVSEHVWCEDFLVRNFFLKNLITNQTRTVTQFHFLTWPENGSPQNVKSILDFRRKVNKSFKGKSSPLIVHCNDGIGRTGTYILIDMVLNKIQRGAKEIDLAATLEFLRDQRPGMVKNKSQFEISFAVVIEEIQNMLKALS